MKFFCSALRTACFLPYPWESSQRQKFWTWENTLLLKDAANYSWLNWIMASGKQLLRWEHYLAWTGFGVPFSSVGVLQLFIVNDHSFCFHCFSANSFNGAACWVCILFCCCFLSGKWIGNPWWKPVTWLLHHPPQWRLRTDKRCDFLGRDRMVIVPPSWQKETRGGNFLSGNVKY